MKTLYVVMRGTSADETSKADGLAQFETYEEAEIFIKERAVPEGYTKTLFLWIRKVWTNKI